jgi:predicted nucleotidyltransferase
MNERDAIVRCVLSHYPATQAIYLFGSYGTENEWPDSDIDVAVLLPVKISQRQPHLMLTPCHLDMNDEKSD